jgi:hypothetical protein
MVGETYAVTGVLGTDTNESGTDIEVAHPHRVQTRGPTDVVADGSIIAIADARTMVDGTVAVRGVITWQNEWDDRVFFFQDAQASPPRMGAPSHRSQLGVRWSNHVDAGDGRRWPATPVTSSANVKRTPSVLADPASRSDEKAVRVLELGESSTSAVAAKTGGPTA